MAAAIASTAQGSGVAAATSEARIARARAAPSLGPGAARGGGGVSGPYQPARAGTNCEGVCGSASNRCTSGRIGVARAGIAVNTRPMTISAQLYVRGLLTSTGA